MKALEKISPDEAVAIILHEIGPALHPFQNGIENEFIADDYAIERGYKKEILSVLKRHKEIELVNDSIKERIKRIAT